MNAARPAAFMKLLGVAEADPRATIPAMGCRRALAVAGVVLLAAVSASAAAQEHPGAEPYRQVCLLCHGPAGRGDAAPALVPFGFDAEHVLTVVREGYGQMPPLSRREIDDDAVRRVAGYLEALTAAGTGDGGLCAPGGAGNRPAAGPP